tara:strand:+ start:994 stop:2022 length:1029 start_codon:yes stop_codon:yes gene_type:complete
MSLKNLNVINKSLDFSKSKIIDKKILKIYNKFEQSLNLNKEFVVAVSGGPDSLALAYLSKIYSQRKNINAKYCIVDHGLRKNSSKEAKFVKKLLKKHSIKLEILNWKGRKPISNIQSIARNARYELLFAKCKKLKVNSLLLGHHLDDLFENFFIRLLRGSGLRGLVSLSEQSKNNQIRILRPLINIEKKDLQYVAKKVFKTFVFDPSNTNYIFKRTKIRKLLFDLEKEGLDKNKFLLTINNLRLSDKSIKYYVKENIEKNAFYSKNRNTIVLNDNFFHNSSEIIFRSLSECIKKVGGNYYFVRGKKLDKTMKNLIKKNALKTTLGGCIIKKFDQTVIISREY